VVSFRAVVDRLAPAAIEAVKQRVYEPGLTQIDASFTLRTKTGII
jgi:hypothetical protein